MGRSIYDINRLKLGWFNAWVGFIISLVLFLPSIKYFIFYEYFLNSSYEKVIINYNTIEIKHDSTKMKVISGEKVFYYYNKKNFSIITDILKKNKNVEIWVSKDDNIIVDLRVNDRFLLKSETPILIAFLIILILSGSWFFLSLILLAQTKGWGAYDLLKKHNKSLLKYLIDELDPWGIDKKRN